MISIRELHNRIGKLVRDAIRPVETRVTDNGHIVSKIIPEPKLAETPYFARRKNSPAFKRLDASGKTGLGIDSTTAVSEDRD